MNWQIPLSTPELGPEEIAAVAGVLQSKWLTMGEITSSFEERFAAKMHVRHAIAVSNCTAALHLANLVCGVGPGDEVICPALTFVASANATRYTGAEVVFADVASQTDLTISPEAIEELITPRTKAITVVHYAGFLSCMDRILAIAAAHGLKVMEDCAHAPFAWLPGPSGERRYAGTLGDVGCFSFFSNKNMTTGEGGMLTTNSDELAQRLRLLRSHGMTSLTYARHTGHAQGYDVVALGYNYRLDEIRSAIGLCQLNKIDSLHASRRRVTEWYRRALQDDAGVVMPFRERELEQSSCHILPVFVPGCAAVVRQRLRDNGVQTSKHYDLVTSFSQYQAARRSSSLLPVEDLITLPLYPALRQSEVAEIAAIIRGITGGSVEHPRQMTVASPA